MGGIGSVKAGEIIIPCGTVSILFALLKLLDVTTWSWWWVFSPLWITLAIIAVIVIVIFGYVVLTDFLDW